MKINYRNLDKKAVYIRNGNDLHQFVLALVYDGKLPITKEHIYSGDEEMYQAWCYFIRDLRYVHKKCKNFGIALDETMPYGCIYCNVDKLEYLGYEIITLEEALMELPNMCHILGATLNQSLEEVGILTKDEYSPRYINLDGLIRANNGGCIDLAELSELLKKVGVINAKETMLDDLFGLKPGVPFKVRGRSFDTMESIEEYKSFIIHLYRDLGLLYRLINDPSMLEVQEKNYCLKK